MGDGNRFILTHGLRDEQTSARTPPSVMRLCPNWEALFRCHKFLMPATISVAIVKKTLSEVCIFASYRLCTSVNDLTQGDTCLCFNTDSAPLWMTLNKEWRVFASVKNSQHNTVMLNAWKQPLTPFTCAVAFPPVSQRYFSCFVSVVERCWHLFPSALSIHFASTVESHVCDMGLSAFITQGWLETDTFGAYLPC